MTTKTAITERKGSFYLRKSFEKKQREVSLGKNRAIAEKRAKVFVQVAEESGYEAALANLQGREYFANGSNPTFEEIKNLYVEFCEHSANAPRPVTQNLNLARLKLFMKRCNVTRIGEINVHTLYRNWLQGKTATNVTLTTYNSAISSASGVFREDALKFYQEEKNVTINNPFKGANGKRAKVKQYVPISKSLREKIFNECDAELDGPNAMIVLMALGIGMRRSEIEACIPSWFSKQTDKVSVNIRAEEHFTPKNGEDGTVNIPIKLYERLLKLRGKTDSKFFVPSNSDKVGTGRIWERVKVVNAWLGTKGIDDRKPLHCLRAECGSEIAAQSGIVEAAKVLRNTIAVASKHYIGVSNSKTVDIGASFETKNPLEEAAKLLGMTVAELEALRK